MRISRFALLLAFCAPSWGAWSYYYPVTHDPTKCGTATSASFVGLVHLSGAAIKDATHSGDVQSSTGADIEVFTDSTLATQVPSQIDNYDNVNGVLDLWTVFSCDVSTPQVLYIAVGNSSPPTRTALSWSSYGFLEVAHMGSASSLTVTDSSGFGNNGTTHGSPSATAGKIGGAAAFTSNGDYIDYGSASSLNIVQSNPYTISGWFYMSNKDTNQYVTLDKFVPGSGYRAYGLSYQSNNMWFHVAEGYNDQHNLGTYDSGGYTPVVATWQYVALVVDTSASTATFYHNGVLNRVVTGFSPSEGVNAVTDSQPVRAGLIVDVGVNGGVAVGPLSLDELHLSNVARSASWITGEYNNQNAPGNIGSPGFWTVGSKTAAGGGGGSTGRRRVVIVQ